MRTFCPPVPPPRKTRFSPALMLSWFAVNTRPVCPAALQYSKAAEPAVAFPV